MELLKVLIQQEIQVDQEVVELLTLNQEVLQHKYLLCQVLYNLLVLVIVVEQEDQV